MDQQIRDRRVLHQDLSMAIRNGELSLHYQPQATSGPSIATSKVIGFEALARWMHPVRGFVSPGEFIPLAEESGLIVEMGVWILREACREAASWPVPMQIAVNLSPAQFMHGDVVSLVHSILLETGLAPDRLELEITEGVLIEDFDRGLALLRRLKALGVRISMDDFGSGYSSLSYLQAFPFDKIKIDRAFVMNLGRNPQSAAIVRAVIDLGHGLEMSIVAEGVETQEQLTFLADEGCDAVQGYFLGKPQPIGHYHALVGRSAANGAETARKLASA
jgi:EAL domain-containing protein (putative c-di-GMP-specific phosphodiesterase class I)